MTRIFTDGAEMRDMSFWSAIQGNIIVDSISPAISPYYYYSDGSTNAYKIFTAISEVYLRFRIKFGGFDPNIRFPRLSSAGTVVAWLTTDAAFRLQAVATTIGVLELSAFVINLNQWYLFEWWYKMDDAPNGRCQVLVDGTSVINYTGDTKPAAGVSFDNIHFYLPWIGNLSLDDLAMNDTAGAVDNSWCGDGVVIGVPPDEDGTSPGNWTGSDADSTDNWLMVDEYPSDGDTTYVYHDATVTGHQEQFHVTSPSMTGKTILRVWPEVRARKTGAVANTLKLGLLGSAGDDMSAGRVVSIGSYTRIVGNDYKANPADAGTWLEADINAQEIIIETAA